MITSRYALSLALVLALAGSACGGSGWKLLYSSVNLTNHLVSFECSPGDPTTNCPCSTADVQLVTHPAYAEITSNHRRTNVFVNAIVAQRFWTFPDGSDLTLDIYKYKASFRLPTVPAVSAIQTQNAETVQMMIQMWDGDNRIWQADSNAIEATFFWDLNPWRTGTIGRVSVYTTTTGALELVDTGLDMAVDTNWHSVEFVANFGDRRFVSITADSITADISSIAIPLVERTNWGSEVVYQITQESCATYPGPGYSNIFYWTTEFRDVEFSRIDYDMSVIQVTNDLYLQWLSEPYLKYQILSSTNLTTWANDTNTIVGDGLMKEVILQPGDDVERMFYRLQIVP